MAAERSQQIATEMAEQCMALQLRQVSRLVTRAYDDALRPLDLTANQLNMLAAVERMGQARQVELATALDMEKSTVSRNMRRMQARGWLVEDTGEDGRPDYQLSIDGRKKLLAAFPAWRGAQRAAKYRVGTAAAKALKKVVSG